MFHFLTDLPAGSEERSGKLHQEALHQVHLSHRILPDLSLPAATGLTAHRTHQPAHAGAPAHRGGVDDSALGAGCVDKPTTLHSVWVLKGKRSPTPVHCGQS